MQQFNYSVICIDFRNYKSTYDFSNFLKDVGLDLNAESWYGTHLGITIPGVYVNRVWIDSVTLNLIAYETDTKQEFFDGFASFLHKSKPIDHTFEYGKMKLQQRQDVTVDSILDKILEKGRDSLTNFELEFLKNSYQS
jgi:hypothetical protein